MMDDDSKRTALRQTGFWVIVAVIVTFLGCIAIVNAVLDVEELLRLEQDLDVIVEFIERLQTAGPRYFLPTPTATP